MAGLVVGFTVGLTGMGGGALMTPILVLLFGVAPTTAVSSDLLASLVMKPVGGGVHLKRGTVNWTMVKWLCLGSVPFAFSGVFVIRAFGHGSHAQSNLKALLGWALLVAAVAMVAKAALQSREAAKLAAHSGPREPRVPSVIPPSRGWTNASATVRSSQLPGVSLTCMSCPLRCRSRGNLKPQNPPLLVLPKYAPSSRNSRTRPCRTGWHKDRGLLSIKYSRAAVAACPQVAASKRPT